MANTPVLRAVRSAVLSRAVHTKRFVHGGAVVEPCGMAVLARACWPTYLRVPHVALEALPMPRTEGLMSLILTVPCSADMRENHVLGAAMHMRNTHVCPTAPCQPRE